MSVAATSCIRSNPPLFLALLLTKTCPESCTENPFPPAFVTLFSTFGDRFFSVYGERRPIAAGFREERMLLYHVYPLLVHVRLFGGGYLGQLRSILKRFL